MAEVGLQTIVSTDDDDGQWKSVNNLDVKKSGNVSPDVYVKTEVGLLRDHSQHYPITGITKWLERLAFLVLIW